MMAGTLHASLNSTVLDYYFKNMIYWQVLRNMKPFCVCREIGSDLRRNFHERIVS